MAPSSLPAIDPQTDLWKATNCVIEHGVPLAGALEACTLAVRPDVADVGMVNTFVMCCHNSKLCWVAHLSVLGMLKATFSKSDMVDLRLAICCCSELDALLCCVLEASCAASAASDLLRSREFCTVDTTSLCMGLLQPCQWCSSCLSNATLMSSIGPKRGMLRSGTCFSVFVHRISTDRMNDGLGSPCQQELKTEL